MPCYPKGPSTNDKVLGSLLVVIVVQVLGNYMFIGTLDPWSCFFGKITLI